MSSSDVSHRRERVNNLLKDDPLACEFKLCLFAGALQTYRQDFCLRPFPPSFMNEDGTRDVKTLKQVFGRIPSLKKVLRHTKELSDDEVEILDSVLTDKVFKAVTCKKDVIDEIRNKVGGFSFDIRPDFVFEVKYTKDLANQSKFSELAETYDIKYGFHGSRFDNFYSIVNNGLQRHMTKNALFGDGIYLSEDLAVTMPYVINGENWKHSVFGESVGCVAVCEILDHPDVKCQTQVPQRSRSHAEGSQAGEVPDKYFVVTNSELVRIKYVLVFGNKMANKSSPSRQWIIRRYPVASVLFLYGIFLVLMGLWRTKQVQVFFKKYLVNQYGDFT